jgi:hypothetical protein
MRTLRLPSGQTIEVDDRDFRSIVCSDREAAMQILGVRRGPPRLKFESHFDERTGELVANVRLRPDGEEPFFEEEGS